MSRKQNADVVMKESIALFTTLDSVCVLALMSDDTYRIYQRGREIGCYDDLDEAAKEMYAFKDRLEREATEAGLFSREKLEAAIEDHFGVSSVSY